MSDYRCNDCGWPFTHAPTCPTLNKEENNMRKKFIEVSSCTDGMLWYAHKIGEKYLMILDSDIDQVYVVRDNEGYSNIIHKNHGFITN
jgi:hypothetical protein